MAPRKNLVQLFPGSTCCVQKNALAWIISWNKLEKFRKKRFTISIFKLLTSPNQRDIYAEEGDQCIKCIPSETMTEIKGCVEYIHGKSASRRVVSIIRAFLIDLKHFNAHPPVEVQTKSDDIEMWDFPFSPKKTNKRKKKQ